jgi:endonuclease/exonuclease/phosphatase (EEP) superfamily protein YafD
MTPWRILAAATAAELCLASVAVAALGLSGAADGWLDLVNCAAPLLIVSGALGALGVRATWTRGRFRAACIAAGAAAAVYGAAVSLPEAAGALSRSLAGGRPGAAYRVIEANVYRANVVPYRTALALRDRRADAVIILEANGTWGRARQILAAAYPYSSACPQTGVEIWLRTPLLAQGCRMPTPPGSYQTWGEDFVWVRTLGPDGRPVVLAAVHLGRPFPPGRQGVERLGLARAMAGFAGQRVILAGDMNAAPWTSAMRALDRGLGPLRRWTFWQPTYPALIKRRPTPPLLPIDHVYAGPGWAPAAIARFRTPGSDHFALQIDARLQ